MPSFTLPLQVAGIIGSAEGGGDVLQLDTILFQETDMEVPDSIGPVGGKQAIAQHDFPGGYRTQQVFGAFPDSIRWNAYLTGFGAFARMQQIDQIRASGREVYLRYGPKAWMGRVASFEPRPRHQWLIPYNIVYMPRLDISQANGADAALSPEAQMADALSGLTSLISGSPFPTPASMLGVSTSLLTITKSALLTAKGAIDLIGVGNATAIAAAAANVITASRPLVTSSEPNVSYMAQALADRAATIRTISTHPISAPYKVIRVNNPNFAVLAAQYLGDAGRWQDIAYFNGFTDPTPIGSFTIKIPSPTTNPIPPA